MSTQALKAAATGRTTDIAAAAAAAGKDPVITALTGAMSKIRNVLPKLITPERMLRIVTNELRVNTKLAQVAKQNPASLVNAVCVAARCGLEIGGPNPEGHLVPHGSEIVFYPDYRGKLKLMRNTGELASFSLEPVYEGDVFELKLGFEPSIDHKPKLSGERGQMLLVYFAATLKNGEKMLVWMTKDQVEKIRKKSKMGNSGAWVSDFEEMAKKTVVHRASKIMPQSTELRIATAAEEAADLGGTATLNLDDPDVIDSTATDVSATEDGDPTQQIDTRTGAGGESGAPVIDRPRIAAMIASAKNTDDLDQALDLMSSSDISGKDQDELRDEIAKVRAKFQGAK